MHSSTWKKREASAASIFGAKRAVLSGNMAGRDDRPGSDSTSERVFLEVKARQRHSVRSLHDEVKELARREGRGRVPVLALADAGRPGFLVCVHSDDLADLVRAWIEANGLPAPIDASAN